MALAVELVADLSARAPTTNDSTAPASGSGSDNLNPLSLGPIRHIAYYSASDSAGVLKFDLSNLKSFREPAIPRSLQEGKRACIDRNRKNTTLGHPIPLDGILEACAAHGTLQVLHNADVVTWRGIITKYVKLRP